MLEGWNRETLPVVQVCDATGELVTMARMTGPRFSPRVFNAEGEYTVRLVLPEAADPRGRVLKTFEKVRVGQGGELVARFEG